MKTDSFAACAVQLANTPDLVAQLLDDHVPTADGYCRCHDVHPERHPCSIRALAELAQQTVHKIATTRRA